MSEQQEDQAVGLLDILLAGGVRANVSACLNQLPVTIFSLSHPNGRQTWKQLIDEANGYDLLTGNVFFWLSESKNEVQVMNPIYCVHFDSQPAPNHEDRLAQFAIALPATEPERELTWRDLPPML